MADTARPCRVWKGALLLTLLAVLLSPQRVSAASIVVNSLANSSTNSDGTCTLREAIQAANSNTASGVPAGECAAGSNDPVVDVITFSLSGTITLSSALPGIGGGTSDDPGYVTIDGDNDDDMVPDIVLDRNGGAGVGLAIGRAASPAAAAVNVTIRGLEIREFGGQAGIHALFAQTLVIEDCIVVAGTMRGIYIQNAASSDVTIRRCRIGLDSTGAAAGNGANGIQVADGADDVTIENSVISANGGNGIRVVGGMMDTSSNNLLIQDNFIGTDLTGTTCGAAAVTPPPWNTFGNGTTGIDIGGFPGLTNSIIEDNVIGCNGRLQGLATGDNQGDGIELGAAGTSGNTIQTNTIGTNSGGANLGNHQNGIDLTNGNTTTITGNTIAFNGFIATNTHQDGIELDGASTDGYLITQNSIYGNDGLGIDIASDGVTDNDANDDDLGANERMNFPFVTSTMWSGGLLDVIGCFDGNPAEANYTLEFFCNDTADTSGYGEGKTFAGSAVLTGDVGTSEYVGTSSCLTTGTLATFLPPASCHLMAATARNALGDTSEFGSDGNAANAAVLACLLAPDSATNTLPGQTTHNVTATVTNGGTAVTGVTVDFTVAGTQAVTGPDPATNGSGVATFTYTNNNMTGVDTISAEVTSGGQTAPCLSSTGASSVTKTWNGSTATHTPTATPTPTDTPTPTNTPTDTPTDTPTGTPTNTPTSTPTSTTAPFPPPDVTITDPFGCTGSGDTLDVEVVVNNPTGSSQAISVQSTLPAGLVGVGGSCTFDGGSGMTSCVVSAGGLTWTGDLPAMSTLTIGYQVTVGASVPAGSTLCIDTAVDFESDAESGTVDTQACTTLNCPTGVDLLRFTAIGLRDRALLVWETAAEPHVLGFNLYRATELVGPLGPGEPGNRDGAGRRRIRPRLPAARCARNGDVLLPSGRDRKRRQARRAGHDRVPHRAGGERAAGLGAARGQVLRPKWFGAGAIDALEARARRAAARSGDPGSERLPRSAAERRRE